MGIIIIPVFADENTESQKGKITCYIVTWQSQTSNPGKATPGFMLLLLGYTFLTPFVRKYQVSPSSYFILQQSSSVHQILFLPHGMPSLFSLLVHSGILQTAVRATPSCDLQFNMPPTFAE